MTRLTYAGSVIPGQEARLLTRRIGFPAGIALALLLNGCDNGPTQPTTAVPPQSIEGRWVATQTSLEGEYCRNTFMISIWQTGDHFEGSATIFSGDSIRTFKEIAGYVSGNTLRG